MTDTAEVAKLKAKIEEMTYVLKDVLDYLEPLMDVVDGDEGRHLPNEEMQLYTSIETTLGLDPYRWKR